MVKKQLIAASLLKIDDVEFNPGEVVENISDEDELKYLESGQIYELEVDKPETKKDKELKEAYKEQSLEVEKLKEKIGELEMTIETKSNENSALELESEKLKEKPAEDDKK